MSRPYIRASRLSGRGVSENGSRRDKLQREPQTGGDVRSRAVTRPNRVATAASR